MKLRKKAKNLRIYDTELEEQKNEKKRKKIIKNRKLGSLLKINNLDIIHPYFFNNSNIKCF